ncbi:MAG: DUF1499 domain-containing protein [Litorimonas sp.]
MTNALTEIDHAPKGTRRLKLRKWVLKTTLVVAIFAPLLFVIAAIGVKFGIWGVGFGFGTLTLKLGPIMLFASGFLGVLSLILACVIKPRRGFWAAGLALIVAAGGIGNMMSLKAKAQRLPFIHDVTTDTQDVLNFTAAIIEQRAKVKDVNTSDYVGKRDNREDKLVSVLQSKAYPKISPLVLESAPDVVFAKVELMVKKMGWKIANTDAQAGLIEATDTSFWYGFEDDVIIRIRPSIGGGTLVDMRSLSRIGQSDLGKNAERIQSFLKNLKTTEVSS